MKIFQHDSVLTFQFLNFLKDSSKRLIRVSKASKESDYTWFFNLYDYIASNMRSEALCEKYPNTELFLVRIFLYSDWIQEGKHEPGITPYLDTFHAVRSIEKPEETSLFENSKGAR